MGQQRQQRVCLFIGPSVSAAEVRAEWGATGAELELLPPVQQGDLLRLMEQPPDAIGIVDGYFFQTPAVLHKEILYAMERGVAVLGASSLGALRAAELDRFGMEGVGAIYRMYQAGAIDGDDEVAVVHSDAEHGFRPLTEPLANIRHNLERARAGKIISARTAAALIAHAKRLPFTERSYAALLGAGDLKQDERDALRGFLRREAIDLKRADALALVRALAERVAGRQPWPPRRPVRANRSIYFHRYQHEYAGHTVDGRQVPDALVLSLQKLLSPALPRMLGRVTLRCLAADEALEQEVMPTGEACLVARFRHDRELLCDQGWEEWLRERCMATHELAACLRERDLEAQIMARYRALYPGDSGRGALLRRLASDVAARLGVTANELVSGLWMRPGVPWEAPLLRESKLRGHFRRALVWVAPLAQRSAELAERAPHLALAAVPSHLERWAAARWGDAEPFERAVLRRGFTSWREFVAVARMAYLAPEELLPRAGQLAEQAI